MKYIYLENEIKMIDENHNEIAKATFPIYKEGVVVVDHTYVDNAYRGQKLASKLMEEVTKYIDKKGLKVVATCPYAIKWYEKHEEFKYVVDKKLQEKLHPECRI